MIDSEHLLSGLGKQGFALAYQLDCHGEIVYFRKGVGDYFERISIEQGWRTGGRRGELVNVDVECAIAPGRTVLKGMAELKFLSELGTECWEGSRLLKSRAEARAWEEAVIALAPIRARQFAEEAGPGLLERTQSERDAARQYGQLIGFSGDLPQLRDKLWMRLSDDQADEVRRIIKTAAIMIPDGTLYYELSMLTIAVCAGQVEGDREWYYGIDPAYSADRRLMIQLQMLASRFAHEPGWE